MTISIASLSLQPYQYQNYAQGHITDKYFVMFVPYFCRDKLHFMVLSNDESKQEWKEKLKKTWKSYLSASCIVE